MLNRSRPACRRWRPRDEGDFATGPHDIDLDPLGLAFVTIGYGGDPTTRETDFGPVGAKFARELLLCRSIARYGSRISATSKRPGTRPVTRSTRIRPASRRTVVADAGANALLQVRIDGRTTALATFPNRMVDAPPFLGLPPGTQIPMDAVPTTVTVGPDGAYYVGQLTGFRSQSEAPTSIVCLRMAVCRRCTRAGSPALSTSRSAQTAAFMCCRSPRTGCWQRLAAAIGLAP